MKVMPHSEEMFKMMNNRFEANRVDRSNVYYIMNRRYVFFILQFALQKSKSKNKDSFVVLV